ncbi:MAG: hypothetical protein K2Q24_07075 [Chitinophagaceae bacterium]|jgi:hypothetical protein|nr:hypothetical protein [Chitinophagaceae bacterium]
MNRKSFLQQTIAAGSIMAAPFLLTSQTAPAANQPKADPVPAEKVKDFVAAGHNNLDKVKQLLAEFPTLIYCTWDWGGGDFETGLEGAGHVGNKEIANYSIGQGARTNLFVLTMLGKTNIVKAYIESYPACLFARGAHGFTLLHHANRGGEDAKELAEYLQSKGLKETRTAL